jgi:single-strand DNA-binding protein
MKGVNQVNLLGRVGKDPEVKAVGDGKTVCRFNMATSEVWKDANGQKQERTEWHRVVIWGKLGEICGLYVKKGSMVYVQGKITTRNWEDKDGVKKYSTEIIARDVQFLDAKGSGSGGGRSQESESHSEGGEDFGPEPSFDTNEEIPF